jgi:hypothetical protein
VKKIWAVSSGEYSDYRVHCICASEEIAEDAVKKMGGFAEEFHLLENFVEPVQFLNLILYFNEDGGTTEERSHSSNEWPFYARAEIDCGWSWSSSGGRGILSVWGVNKGRVGKVYTEKKAIALTDPVFRGQRWAKG